MNEQVRTSEGLWKIFLFTAIFQVYSLIDDAIEPVSLCATIFALILTAELYLVPEFYRNRPIFYRVQCAFIGMIWIFAAIIVVLEWT